MNFIEVCRKVRDERSCYVFRERKDADNQYDAKPWAGRGGHREWILIDLFSASAVANVYDALGDENKAKYETVRPYRAIEIAFKLTTKEA